MSEILKQAALQRALALLKTAEVQYKVIMADGTVETNIEEPKKVGVRRPKVNNFNRDYNHIRMVQEAKVGDILCWTVPDNLQHKFEDALRSATRRYWGTGNFITTVEGGQVKALRT